MGMSRTESEIQDFLKLKSDLLNNYQNIYSMDPFGLVFKTESEEKIDLLISGLIHGDEVIGIEIINSLLRRLSSKEISCAINLGFLLGNVEAARQSKRYLEEDLNRSFGLKRIDKIEEKRAREISKIRFVVTVNSGL